VGALKSIVDGNVSPVSAIYDPDKITKYIKNWTKKLGAVDVGVTELKDYHKYSYRGRNGTIAMK